MNTIYDWFMAPLEALRLRASRKSLMSKVSGKVLEIGTGTGANLPYFDYSKIEALTLSDLKLSKRARSYVFPEDVEVVYNEAPLEALKVPPSSFDSIVFTLVFCSVDDPLEGLQRVYELLKPGGKIYFIEHVMPDHHHVRKAVNGINPHWRKIASGCNLNRETLETIKEAGFVLEKHSVSLGGALIEGVAVKP
ncbi:class I SAM-dependent methyltransferase [Acidaminobacter hydrogenoformans]|uniref:Methyltransferase domain-containing protein n=1 Tax=Acidaminobacter hydrogenoformans DSM 2784 TaxID=1120920 RepID=A0A1G5S5B3_9FIRM|nr:class I SAM-dependent methyltransferase [Acidaminobacter hydrogenoformans]SCZ81544.1 Methyltransferase domain-containing protein [Acidaminobacter hydrogenoformans DSM 2784]